MRRALLLLLCLAACAAPPMRDSVLRLPPPGTVVMVDFTNHGPETAIVMLDDRNGVPVPAGRSIHVEWRDGAYHANPVTP